MAVCFKCNQAAHEPHNVLHLSFAKQIVSGARLTPRTASSILGVAKDHIHVLARSTTGVQLMEVFQLVEKGISDEAAFSQGYF